MLSVALTGNIASGKSTVAELFRSWGAAVLDADAIVRQLQEPGTPVMRAIGDRWPGVIGPEGELDRPALRRAVMGSPGERQALEAIVHPAVERRRRELADQAEAAGARIVVSDIPLLFEAGDPAAFDAVILVDAPAPVRRRRLMERRGLSAEEADALIAAQAPSEPKRAASTFIVDNDGDLGALERAARAVWRGLERRAGRP